MALIPLRHGDRILGLVQFNDRNRGRFTAELMSFLESTADQIAIALAQRQSQAAMDASEVRYRRLFEVESDAIFLIDTETLRFIDINGTASKLYGYSREEFLQLTADDVSAESERTRQAIAHNHSQIFLRWHRKKDGTIFPVEIAGSYFDCQGRKIHVAAIRDITDRKRMEQSLRDSEQKHRSLFDNSIDAVFFTEPNGKVLAANWAACAMFGMTEEELCRTGARGSSTATIRDTSPRWKSALERAKSAAS